MAPGIEVLRKTTTDLFVVADNVFCRRVLGAKRGARPTRTISLQVDHQLPALRILRTRYVRREGRLDQQWSSRSILISGRSSLHDDGKRRT